MKVLLTCFFEKTTDKNCFCFLCIQEISYTDLWERDQFRKSIDEAIKLATCAGKTPPMRVIGSYLVPDVITKKEMEAFINSSRYLSGANKSGWDHIMKIMKNIFKSFKNFYKLHFFIFHCFFFIPDKTFREQSHSLMNQGMRDMALRIKATRDSLLNLDIIPIEICRMIIAFVFFNKFNSKN